MQDLRSLIYDAKQHLRIWGEAGAICEKMYKYPMRILTDDIVKNKKYM